jgi:hypothetical protein
MTKARIYYTKPSITELEIMYATDAAINNLPNYLDDAWKVPPDA